MFLFHRNRNKDLSEQYPDTGLQQAGLPGLTGLLILTAIFLNACGTEKTPVHPLAKQASELQSSDTASGLPVSVRADAMQQAQPLPAAKDTVAETACRDTGDVKQGQKLMTFVQFTH